MNTTWDDVRRIADEVALKIHLAGMDARERWHALEPRLSRIEKQLGESGARLGKIIDDEVTAVGTALRKLRDDLAAKE